MYLFYVCLILVHLIIVCNGMCPTDPLFRFIQNSTIAATMTTDGTYYLPTDGRNSGTVLPAAYVSMKCNSGYVLTGGQLNITCAGDQWTTFPICVLNTGSGSMTTTIMSTGNGSPCVVDRTTTDILTNGYASIKALSYFPDGTVTGSIQFACGPGYVLDPTIGASYVCNNGQWSTKPRCLITGRCRLVDFTNFITNSPVGIQTTGQSSLMQLPSEPNVVLNGSYIVLTCSSGYMNTGGSLNVTCNINGLWSQFPQCVSSTGSGSMTTTIMSTGNGSPCVVDRTTTDILTNGYASIKALSYFPDGTVTGSIQFACGPGYVLDPTIGASYVCNNGQWSTKPRCLITGRCRLVDFTNFITNSPVGIQTTGQSSLMQLPSEPNVVLNGSYIVLTCSSGYMNTGGSLNVTCNTNGLWSQFPQCVSSTGSGSMTTTMISTGNGSPCVVDRTTTDILTNGYASIKALTYLPDGTVTGSIQFACGPGYVLDPTIGASYVCNNGQWSTKPQCLITGRCRFADFSNFITSSPAGIQTTGQSSLMQLPSEPNVVLNGSYIVLTCSSGYMNTGGSLNVTCNINGLWSQFPQCVSSTGSGSMTTTIMSTGNGSPCVVDRTTTDILTNGYASIKALSYFPDGTVTGSIQFACGPGYVLDPTIGASYVCNNGQWSTKPRCPITGRCRFADFSNFITSSPAGIQTTNQSSLMQLPSEPNVVLNGSYIVLTCSSGYMNTGGSLNVTCNTNGSWSQFPQCVSSTGSGSMTTTMISTGNGSPCVVDRTTTDILTNGYASIKALSYFPDGTVTGSIQFACGPGYVLDPTIGASYVCNNGQWSTKPRCLITGRCRFADFTNFITNSPVGIQTTGQSSLMQLPSEPNVVLNGSYIVLTCSNGYMNIGGNLNVTCNTNGLWSQFPQCVSSTQTTTISSTTGMGQGGLTTQQLSSNCTDTPYVVNGYVSNATSIQYTNNRYERKVEFTCYPGYIHVNTSGHRSVSCINGVWDALPICAVSPTCSKDELQSGLRVGMRINSSSLLSGGVNNPGILAGGWLYIYCDTNYRWNPLSGPLNITCLRTGRWTTFPSCTS